MNRLKSLFRLKLFSHALHHNTTMQNITSRKAVTERTLGASAVSRMYCKNVSVWPKRVSCWRVRTEAFASEVDAP